MKVHEYAKQMGITKQAVTYRIREHNRLPGIKRISLLHRYTLYPHEDFNDRCVEYAAEFMKQRAPKTKKHK